MGNVKLNEKPTAEDFEYAYVEDSTGAIVRVPKDKIIAMGKDGGYYIPTVDDDGNLAWSASEEGMPEIDGTNIKGPQGETGPQGDQGEAGEPGYTPVKGKDYYTEDDKQEMVKAVLKEIPDDEFVKTTEQTLTEEQQTQARSNIGAASTAEVNQLSEEIVDLNATTLKEADKQSIVQDVLDSIIIENPSAYAIYGVVDENNVVTLYGDLSEDDTYTFNYEKTDGTIVEIGTASLVEEKAEPVNQFVASADNINKYVSTSTGAFSARGGAFCVEVDGISLADNNPYIVRISGVTLVKDTGDGSWGRVALLNSSGTLIGVQHITDDKITQDGDSWYFNLHDFSSDATATKCRFNMWLRTDRSNITLSDVANLFVEFEPLNV